MTNLIGCDIIVSMTINRIVSASDSTLEYFRQNIQETSYRPLYPMIQRCRKTGFATNRESSFLLKFSHFNGEGMKKFIVFGFVFMFVLFTNYAYADSNCFTFIPEYQRLNHGGIQGTLFTSNDLAYYYKDGIKIMGIKKTLTKNITMFIFNFYNIEDDIICFNSSHKYVDNQKRNGVKCRLIITGHYQNVCK